MRRIFHRPQPARRTAAMVAGDALLLALSLTGVFLYQFHVYALPGSGMALLWTCLAAAALVLLVFSLPRLRWAAALAAVLVGLAVLYHYREPVSQGAQTVYAAAAHALTESTDFPGEVPVPDWRLAEIARNALPLGQDQWWNAPSLEDEANCFLTAVVFALALPLGWAVVRRRSFWLTLLLTLPWLIPPFLAEFPPDLLSLSLVVSCWMALILSGLTARGDPEGGARLTLAALPMALAALLCIGLLFPQERYTYPDWAASAAQRLTEAGERIENPFLPGGSSGAAAERVALTGSEPPRYTGREVLRVSTDFSGKLYLRGPAYGVYTGERWQRLDEEALAELETLALPDPDAFLPIGMQGDLYSVTVSCLDGPSSIVYYPYGLTGMSAVSYEADSYLRPAEPWESYTLNFHAGSSRPQSILTGETVYRQFVYEHYLEVPEELAETLTNWRARAERLDMGEWTAPGVVLPWQVEAANEVARLLAGAARYDLQTPAAPMGEDFATWFLTESQRGYCVHYATAATLLLRLEGIPARYVTGYLAQVSPGENTVRDSAAHAWVEIYVDGCGWYPVEVTPGGEGDDPVAEPSVQPSEELEQPTPEPSQPASEEPELPTLEPSEEPAPTESVGTEPSPVPGDPEQPGTEPGGPDMPEGEPADLKWLWGAAAAGLLLGLPLLYRAFRRRRWDRLTRLPDNNRAVLEIYGRHQKLARWGGEPDPRLEELAQKARFSQHTLTGEERREALSILCGETGRVYSRLPAWERPLFRYLFIWK